MARRRDIGGRRVDVSLQIQGIRSVSKPVSAHFVAHHRAYFCFRRVFPMVEVVGEERDAVGSMLLEYPQIALMVDDVFADFRRREGNSLVIPIEAAVSQLLSGFIIVGKDSLFGNISE